MTNKELAYLEKLSNGFHQQPHFPFAQYHELVALLVNHAPEMIRAMKDNAKRIAELEAAHANTVQQAQIQAQEMRTQKAIVQSLLKHFDCPAEDWHALELITAAVESRTLAAMEALKDKAIELIEKDAEDHLPEMCTPTSQVASVNCAAILAELEKKSS